MVEFMAEVLRDVPSEKPIAQRLVHPAPPGPARELPGGRGWLRLVESGKDGPAPTAPRVHVTVPIASGPGGQMDLLAWAPTPPASVKPRPPVQLDLFGIEIEPEK